MNKNLSVLLAAIAFFSFTSPLAYACNGSDPKEVEQESLAKKQDPFEVTNDQQYYEKVEKLIKYVEGLKEFSKCNFTIERQATFGGGIERNSFNLGDFNETGDSKLDTTIYYSCRNGINCVTSYYTSLARTYKQSEERLTYKVKDAENNVAIIVNNIIKFCKSAPSANFMTYE
jgi:hypothetical protein